MTSEKQLTEMRGKPVVDALTAQIQQEVALLANGGITPKLAMIRLGARADDLAYERNLAKRCELLGVATSVCELPVDASDASMAEALARLSADESVHGILPFRPLPGQISPDTVKGGIMPDKDVDCIGPFGSACVYDRSLQGFVPSTAEAVLKMLQHYEVPLEGANAVLLGRSMVVGRALALLMLDAHCTVTICHSRTRNLKKVASSADILVCAMGCARMVDASYVKPGASVIDVGINDDCNGGICGDVDFASVSKVAARLTPVPGGIGAVTTTMLIRNVVTACKKIVL